MGGDSVDSSKRVLEPIERVSEVLFGLIMVLGITGSLSVAEAGHAEVRTMLFGALGCNLAWGVIDGVFYLMGCLAERGRALTMLRAVRAAIAPQVAERLIAEALPPKVASVLRPEEIEAIHQRLARLPEPVGPARLTSEDLLGAVGVFLLVFLSTFPPVVPFMVMGEAASALLVSRAIGIFMLFLSGYAFGRVSGHSRWGMGLSMVVLGVLLVALTTALGG